MRLNFFAIFILCFLISSSVDAQKKYWQQKVDNNINVTLDDKRHVLRGNIQIHYQNNSPDTLTYIYFHLYPNAYKNTETAFARQHAENKSLDFFYSEKSEKGQIDSIGFDIQYKGKYVRAKEEKTKNIDIVKILLPEKLLPGKSVDITTNFRVKIPKVFSRLGHTDQAYQISQWFPKPAVYDAKGWHPIPYLDQGEFYSEFGDYKVAITLPSNYVVMATGNISESSEQKWLDGLCDLVIDSNYIKSHEKTPKSDSTFKTITFTEKQIHDFAWFANKNWVVRKDTVLSPVSNEVITAYSAFFPADYEGWKNSVEDIKTTIRGYGNLVGPYPYKTVKVVEGSLSAGGGMEYPTVTVIDAIKNPETIKSIIIHEVGHNWFYGILASNERSFPWMDEGINSFYETKLFKGAPGIKNKENASENNIGVAAFGAAHNLFPATTASEDLPYMNYGIDIYAKVPLYVNYLEQYMGSEDFNAAMRKYFNTWKFKHPQPEDFEKIFKEKSKKDISWFFELMNNKEAVDFKIKNIQKKNGGITVNVENKNDIKLPVLINIITAADTIRQWSEPFTGSKEILVNGVSDYNKVMLDNYIPDINLKQNQDKKSRSLKLLGGLNYNRSNNIWIAPSIGINKYDGFMAGLFFHNVSIPQNKFRFIIAPMFGLRSKDLVGHAKFNYTQYLNSDLLSNIDFKLNLKSYGYDRSYKPAYENISLNYYKIAPEIIFNFHKPFYRSTVSQGISIKGYYIAEQDFKNDTLIDAKPIVGDHETYIYGTLGYFYKDTRTINPYSFRIKGQLGDAFAKISAEANFKFNYSMKGKALHLRAYAGKFFALSDNYFDYARYQLANTYSGVNDYLYDETFGGRNESRGIWAQQVDINEGGFKSPTLQYANQVGLNDDYLLALNLKTDLPLGKLPIRLFFDVSTFGGDLFNDDDSRLLYNAGVEIHLMDYITIHLPVFMSKEFKDYNTSILGGKYLKTITFSHNLNNINWLKLPNQFLNID